MEMFVEIEYAHPMEISIRGFDASHLLQYSTNRFFRLNGKQAPSNNSRIKDIIGLFHEPYVGCCAEKTES